MTWVAVGLGGASLASGLFAKDKQRTPGFGLTNSDDIMQLLMQLGFGGSIKGQGIGGKNDYFGSLGSAGGPNLVGQIQQSNQRDLPQLDMIQQLLSQNMNVGQQGIRSLMDLVGRGNQQVGQAGAALTNAPNAALTGAYDNAKASAQRDLPRIIQGIFRQANAGAASRGIKSQSTFQGAAAQGTRAAESVQNILAGLDMRQGEQKAAYAAQGAQGNLQALLQRLGATEGMSQFGLQTNLGLRGAQGDMLLKMMNTRRQMETDPQRTAMDIVKGFPGYNASPVPQSSFAGNLSNSLAGGANLWAGYQGQKAGQQQWQDILKLLQGGNAAPNPGSMGPY